MRIVIGRGKNDDTRHVFQIPRDKIEREKMAEDFKNYLFRPAMLKTA